MYEENFLFFFISAVNFKRRWCNGTGIRDKNLLVTILLVTLSLSLTDVGVHSGGGGDARKEFRCGTKYPYPWVGRPSFYTSAIGIKNPKKTKKNKKNKKIKNPTGLGLKKNPGFFQPCLQES